MGSCFVTGQMVLVAMDTIQLHNHYVLWQLSKKQRVIEVTLMQSRSCLCGISSHSIVHVAKHRRKLIVFRQLQWN